MRRRFAARALSVLLLVVGASRSASPAELAAFVSFGLPTADWSHGYGGIFTITLFNLVHGELEATRLGSDLADTSLLSLSAKVYVGPTIGRFVPYAGLGAGVYIETRPGDDDKGTLGTFFIGTKFKLPLGVLLRAEYDWVSLPAAAPVKLDGRFFIGVGIGI